jgi:HEAT repeats
MGAVTVSTAADREEIPRRVKESELIAAVRGRSETLGSVEALKELIRRRSRKRTTILMRVVMDEGETPDLRTTAAVELGKERRKGHQEALLAALRSKDPSVVRRSAEALGRIGDESALEALASVRIRRGAVRRSVEFAKTLISYRLRLETNRLRPPSEAQRMELNRRRAVPLEVEKPRARELETILPLLRRELPTIPVSPEAILRFSCGADRFLVVFNRDVHRRKTLTPVAARSAVPAVVLKRSPSLERFYVYEYLLTHPSADGTLLLFGVRTTGVVAHFGEVQLEPARAEFKVGTIETRYSPPVTIEGSYEHDTRSLVFSVALVERDFAETQRPAAVPAKLSPGLG